MRCTAIQKEARLQRTTDHNLESTWTRVSVFLNSIELCSLKRKELTAGEEKTVTCFLLWQPYSRADSSVVLSSKILIMTVTTVVLFSKIRPPNWREVSRLMIAHHVCSTCTGRSYEISCICNFACRNTRKWSYEHQIFVILKQLYSVVERKFS